MTYHNILIVKLSAIGDVVHALPVAHALKTGFPQAKITWIVEKPAYELVANHPYIDEVILFDKSRCRTLHEVSKYLPELSRELKSRHFDLSLDLQGLFKSGLIAWLSKARQRFVYCHARELSDWFSRKVCGPHQNGHIIDQYLDLPQMLGCLPEPVDFGIRFSSAEAETVKQILYEAGWHGEAYVAIIPGANWLNKRWPAANFAKLLERLDQRGIRCLVVGGKDDLPLAESIHKHTSVPFLTVIGKTTIKQLAWVLQNASVTVGGDTGPMHLSVAVGTPTVTLMGPTDPRRNGPYSDSSRVLVAERECKGCWKRQCEKKLDCLAVIPVEAVEKAVVGLLREN